MELIGILGMKIVSPLACPVMSMASSRCGLMLLMMGRVPLELPDFLISQEVPISKQR